MRIFTGAAARRTLIGAVAAAATVVVGTTIAAADPGGDDGVGAFLLTSGGEVGAVLCGPDVGVHPDPAGACETIRSAGGDFENLPAEQHTMCTMILQPTPAHAWGVWSGSDGIHPVEFAADYGNPCMAAAQSGGVFGF